jgi:hypothetical protein
VSLFPEEHQLVISQTYMSEHHIKDTNSEVTKFPQFGVSLLLAFINILNGYCALQSVVALVSKRLFSVV